eukprot:TRINITY_DN1740_c0_g3_i1.p1 TRINITY_DN1740_c0_g3~~TRINITY_DN1740_c0_g3_i1.p1  ORF type:complete len:152 (-),score=14.95 TRINITY_DN1740_c0_g3_i1:176-631(-)
MQCEKKEVAKKEEIKEARGRQGGIAVDQPLQSEVRNSLNPPLFMKEGFDLSVMQRNLLMQPYRQIPPSFRFSNPMAELNTHNYMMFNSDYGSSDMPNNRQSFPLLPPRPIFRHCAIHAGIAYFIHSNHRRQVHLLYLVEIGPRRSQNSRCG